MSKARSTYIHLAEMIETGRLSPGEIVTEAALMEVTGAGRTPLREAVQALLRDRWLESAGSRGNKVPSISVDDQLSRLEVRRSLEVLAVGLACAREDAEQVAKVADHVAELERVTDLDSYVTAVARSHLLLRQIASNEYLADALAPLQGLSRRFWLATARGDQEEVQRGQGLYVPALQAVIDRDVQAARSGILALHDFLAASAIDYARRRVEIGRIEPPEIEPSWVDEIDGVQR